MIFTVFDRDALIWAMKDNAVNSQRFNSIRMKDGLSGGISSVNKWSDNVDFDPATGEIRTYQADIEYADQIPPFDITISFVNEYGQSAVMRLIGVEILNEGSGMSIDDITTDKACTFVARGIEYIRPIQKG